MINNIPFQNPEVSPTDGDTFPPFKRPLAADDNRTDSPLSGDPFLYESGFTCTITLTDGLLEKFRKDGEETEVQHRDEVPLTVKAAPVAADSAPLSNPPASQQPAQVRSHPPKKSNKNDSNDHQRLINRLSKKPHIVEFKGVVMDRNERLKIIAAVAVCESGKDQFSAESLDTEFHMAQSPNLSYARIVHIGLSYGIIQFTQDSGNLGKLLQRMHEKDAEKFTQIFGSNNAELITLTTSGIEVANVDYVSGQAHWNSIRNKPAGRQLSEFARLNKLPQSSEIRGKRVQPIATVIGGPKQDLWEGAWKQRFIDAGKVDRFQEAELEFAVEGYLNPALNFCKKHNIRSAIGIAYVAACAIRGSNKDLIVRAATKLSLKAPFSDGADERKSVQYISELNTKEKIRIDGQLVQRDEIVRARTLLKDGTGFLAEDLYWIDTFTTDYDK